MFNEEYQYMWDKATKEYVIITDINRNVLEVSENVKRLFKDINFQKTCIDYFAKAKQNEVLEYQNKKYKVRVTRFEKRYIIIFSDCTELLRVTAEIKNLENLAKNYEMLFNNFGNSSMYVTDEKGITTWVGEQVARTCGVQPEYLIGKSVYELENEGIFYPSITAKVLETLSYETIIQSTAMGQQAVSMGFPLFDKDNHLVKVISFSKPVNNDGMAGFDETAGQREIYFPEIISESGKMTEVKNMVEAAAKVDTPVMIYGEAGVGKEDTARCIHKLSRRCNGQFIVFNVDRYKREKLMEMIFGSSSEVKKGMLYKSDGGTFYISNLYSLPYEVQKKLFHFMKDGYIIADTGEHIVINVRFIASCVSDDNIINMPDRHCRFLNYMFQAMQINIPPLRECREDILLLIRYYKNRYEKRYATKCKISKEAMQCLYAYDWNGNKKELKKFIKEIILQKENGIVNVDDLPDYILNNEKMPLHTEIYDLVNDIDLNSAVEKLERYMISNSMRKFGTAKKAAEALGITQSTFSRKAHKYGVK